MYVPRPELEITITSIATVLLAIQVLQFRLDGFYLGRNHFLSLWKCKNWGCRREGRR
jgi:hypothetical protein